MKVLEWNINKRSRNTLVEPFVCERILLQEADVVCLVEYTEDQTIKAALKPSYWIFESIPSNGNQILLAVNKSFAKEEPIVIRNHDEYACYNLLHIRIKDQNEKETSIVGIRMLTGKGRSRIDAKKQAPPLNKYLETIEEAFLCVGDFNIRESRMSYWFPNYRMQEIEIGKRNIEEASYFFPKTYSEPYIATFGVLDHILTSKELKASAKYNWDFVCDHDTYPSIDEIKNGCYWKINPGFPDHAMLIAEILPTYNIVDTTIYIKPSFRISSRPPRS